MARTTVVIATYNRPHYLRQTLASVCTQEDADVDVVVVDDDSTTPGNDEVCAAYSNCRYIRQQHGGRSVARNRGIGASDSEFVAFVDDDDLWKPSKLARQVAMLTAESRVGFVHCPVEEIDADGAPTGRVLGALKPETRQGQIFAQCVRHCVVGSPTPLVRRGVLERTGGFLTTLEVAEDKELWARIAYVTEIGWIPEPLASYRVHPASHTDPQRYLDANPVIIESLSNFVDAADRDIVHRECARSYLVDILHRTEPGSTLRRDHLRQVLRLWPRTLLTRQFLGVLLNRDRRDRARRAARADST
jgi:glycosyltransferase involved in cell wall biosynthesis